MLKILIHVHPECYPKESIKYRGNNSRVITYKVNYKGIKTPKNTDSS